MIGDVFLKFTGKIDRRSPQDEGKPEDPVIRENWLCRDGKLSKPPGHESKFTDLTDIPRWISRYNTTENSVISPKTFVYTQDGIIRVLNDSTFVSTSVKTLLNEDAYPRSWLFKAGDQNKLFFVDGENLYRHDGNNSNLFEKVDLNDSDGNAVNPIDVIEHKDRLFVISKTKLFVSKNLGPEVFDDANDSIEIIVGSGKGFNLALGKIEDKLYIFNTEGIFALDGDVISALASTFEVRLVDDTKIIVPRSVVRVEKALLFIADDFELRSWDGNSCTMLSFELKLKDYFNRNSNMLDKASAIYHNNYYKLSFVETGESEPDLEVWWDAFEDKIDLVRGRHVSCYMRTDPTIESEYVQMGQSDENKIVQDEIDYDFDGTAIVTRLRTRDILIKKGLNVRFLAFYPQFEPTGDRDLTIIYLLDGRSSQWTQNLRGEIKTLGFISINNQAQAMSRVRPNINYARGQSIAFDITEETLGQKSDFIGMGMDYITKYQKKGVAVGA